MRQYIGARYVPKLFNNNGSSEWVSGMPYEALTIVTYNSNSYTSSQNVPATTGNPQQNPEYWTNTGNYNGFMSELSQQISDLQQSFVNFTNQTQAQLNNQLKSISNMQGFKYYFVGDSYGMDTEKVTGWITKIKEICQAKGIVANGQGYGGYGIKGFSGNFKDVMNQWDLENYTHLIMLEGCNDFGTLEELEANLIPVINYCKEKNCHFVYGFIGNRFRNYQEAQDILQNYKIMFTLCLKHGVEFITESFIWNPSKSLYQSDLVHPNNYGTDNIANNCFQALCHEPYYTSYDIKNNDATWFNAHIEGDIMRIEIYCIIPKIEHEYQPQDQQPFLVLPRSSFPYDLLLFKTIGMVGIGAFTIDDSHVFTAPLNVVIREEGLYAAWYGRYNVEAPLQQIVIFAECTISLYEVI